MILVTGAAGKTGRAVISALVAKGLSVRALIHRENQAQTMRLLGAKEVVVGDVRSQSTLTKAVRNVEALYHICPNVSADEFAIGKAMIAAAQLAGGKLFVFHSVLHPQVEAMPHHWNKLRVEEALFASDLSYVILQPAAYMQNVLAEWQSIAERGVYAVPYSVEAKMSLVDLDNVAQAAAIVLSERGHEGAIYELAGPEVLTPSQMASIIGKILGKDVHAEKTSVETWKRRAEVSGLGPYQIETLVKMFNYYDLHGLWGNSRTLEGLIRRPPTKLMEFIERTVREHGH